VDQYPAFQAVSRFDRLVIDLKLKTAGTPLQQQADMLRAMYDDIATLGLEKSNAKWIPRLPECNQGRIALERFVEAVEPLKSLPRLKSKLKIVLASSIIQDFKPTPAKEAFYELEIAATLKLAGFDVELTDPDIIAQGNGLSKPLGIACKYPSSRERMQDNVTKGYEQVEEHCRYGAVCIGLDLLVAQDAGLEGRIDFRRGDLPALEIQFKRLVSEVRTLKEKRDREYVGRHKLDGLIMSVNIVGMSDYGIERLESSALGCLAGNPMMADLEIIRRGINAIRGG